MNEEPEINGLYDCPHCHTKSRNRLTCPWCDKSKSSPVVQAEEQPVTKGTRPMTERRLKILTVTRDLLPQLFQRDDLAALKNGKPVRLTGWPSDGRIVGGGYNFTRDCYEFQVESPSFPPCVPGEELDRFTLASEVQATAHAATGYATVTNLPGTVLSNTCPNCNGLGPKPGRVYSPHCHSFDEECTLCRGTGVVIARSRTMTRDDKISSPLSDDYPPDGVNGWGDTDEPIIREMK